VAADPDGPAVPGSLAWATWALFVGLAAMLAGAGLFGTLVGVRGDLEGFAVSVIGIISAAYYAGFLIGSRLARPGWRCGSSPVCASPVSTSWPSPG
jgi:hypothetical protein